MESLAEKIQDSELEIMHVLWKADRSVALSEIRHELSQKCGWEDSTIKTLLRRLCNKGAVELKSRGVYSAVISEKEYDKWSIRCYVSKVFLGSAKKLVASLVEDGQLTVEDIEELAYMFNEEQTNE